MPTTQLLTLDEAADHLRMLPSRVARLVRIGAIPHIALPDGEIRFDAAQLEVWVLQHQRPSSPSEMPAHGK